MNPGFIKFPTCDGCERNGQFDKEKKEIVFMLQYLNYRDERMETRFYCADCRPTPDFIGTGRFLRVKFSEP
jgi:hypothetical protein